MNTDLAARVREHIAKLPVPPAPPFVEPAPRRATARLVPVAAALAVLAVLVLGVVRWGGGGGEPPFADGERRPGLPSRWARYSHFTGSVSQSPPGPAIAVYQHGWGVETLDFPQGLVLSAYSDVYRRVDLADDREDSKDQGDPAPMLLSPDGKRLAVGSHEGRGDLALLDLSTGRVTTVAAGQGKAVRPLAWSRDGRHIAALELPASATNQTSLGPLVVFDLSTGTTMRWAQQEVAMAAFSPDGTQLALQSGGSIVVIDLDGRTVRTFTMAGELTLTSESAWSPDGRLIAGVLRHSASYFSVAFLDVTGQKDVSAFEPIMDSGPRAVAGWLGPDRLLMLREDNRFAEVDIVSGQANAISEFDTGPGDGFALAHVQFASELLLGAEIRPAGEPDRGPWPTWMQVVASVFLLALGLLGAFIVRKAIRRPR